ncbi:MAG TPA: NAD(P)/FAD-dependent oxidoreductase [Pseudonocardia sp.]|nr:NAD(P)/FAD-dependent oxidoreductase [Pseudonocardia sp.]
MSDTVDAVDAVVIGSGVNGLVAAAELARAGWSVALVERNDRLGGFIATEERTLPGYLHDTYSSWHPLFLAGPAYTELGGELHRHGLEYCNTEGWAIASVADDGRAALAHRDPQLTAAEFAHEADRGAYLGALQRFLDNAGPIGGLLGSELHSPGVLRHLGSLVRANGRAGSEEWLRDLASSGRAWTRRHFEGTEVDQLWAPWLLHAGLSPDNASGGMMVPVLAATLHGFGLPVVAGGAGAFAAAFAALLAEHGAHVHTGAPVERILTEDGRAVGVTVAGQIIRARRAVLASVSPGALYRALLPAADVPSTVHEQAATHRPGRAAMMIHVALSAPLTWTDNRLTDVPLIHLSDGAADTAIACAEAEAGLLPRRPTVVVGRQYLLDPSRVPAGTAALWLQLQEVPYAPVGDAAAELDTAGGWTEQLAKGYAARVLDRIARHAPDLSTKVRATDVITPTDLEAHNPNAEHGDPYGGSAELDQNFWWRPMPSAGSHRTAVAGLWHIGAATHPGAGLGGGSGHLAAQALLQPTGVARLRRLVNPR